MVLNPRQINTFLIIHASSTLSYPGVPEQIDQETFARIMFHAIDDAKDL